MNDRGVQTGQPYFTSALAHGTLTSACPNAVSVWKCPPSYHSIL
jgi:hypothetical protein